MKHEQENVNKINNEIIFSPLSSTHTRWYFTHRCRMPPVPLITVRALHEDARVAQTFGKYLTANVVQPDTLADVTSSLFHHLIPVHIRQQAKTESLNKIAKKIRDTINRHSIIFDTMKCLPFRIGRIRKAVDCDRRLGGMKRFTDAQVQFVIADRAPECRLMVHHRLCIHLRWRHARQIG